MILLVDLCYERDSLSKYEFVIPIAQTLQRTGTRYSIIHLSDLTTREIKNAERIILCGTALKDNSYLDCIEAFSWISGYDRPLLGICAGMQMLACTFSGKIVPQPEIGLREIHIQAKSPLLGEPRTISGYHLHNFGVSLPQGFDLLAGSPDYVEAFKCRSRPVYGIIFHPEVRNRWIIQRFATLPL